MSILQTIDLKNIMVQNRILQRQLDGVNFSVEEGENL